MSRLLAVLLGLALPLVLSGCGGSSADDSDDLADDGDDGDDDDGDDDDGGSDDDDDSPPADSSISGRVIDGSGNPIEGINVTCCSDERCITGETVADGTFAIENLTANIYVVDNLSVPDNDVLGWSKFFEFVTVGEAEDVTIERDLVIPQVTETVSDIVETDENVTDSPRTIEFANEIQVDYDGVDAELPFTAASLDNPTLGVVEVPAADWPQGGLGNWSIVRVWAFAPFEFGMREETDNFSVTVPLAEALVADTEVGLLWADYDEGIHTESFMESVGTLSADGLTVTGDVHKLSLLIIATPSS